MIVILLDGGVVVNVFAPAEPVVILDTDREAYDDEELEQIKSLGETVGVQITDTDQDAPLMAEVAAIYRART